MKRAKFLFYILIIVCLFSFPRTISTVTYDDHQAITDMVRDVKKENLWNTVFDLQENRDINPPYKPYKSRYCLRVWDTDDPSDGACDNVAEYIYNKFAGYGLDVEYDTFVHEVKEQGKYTMRNVVATLPGKGSGNDKIYVICAHYDSTAGLSAGWMWYWKTLPAPGADDNASGVAGVIEAARILSKYSFNNTIKFIAFSGEELGMFGSKHYARLAAEAGHKIIGVLNLDMIAYDPDMLDIDIVTNEDSYWIANAAYRTVKIYDIDLIVNKIIKPEMVYSDHSSFWRNGYNAALITESVDSRSSDFSPVNHTADDTIEKLNFDFALLNTQMVVATLAQLADPLTGFDDIVNPDLIIDPESVIFSHIPSSLGEKITIKAKAVNLGPDDVKNVSAQIWIVSPLTGIVKELAKEWTLDLKKGISYDISTTISLTEWGNYKILVRINHDCRVFESDFSNNQVWKTIFVDAKLGVADLKIYPNPVNLSDNGKINIKYKLSQDAKVNMEIYDIHGGLIYNSEFPLGENGGRRGPNNNITWDGKNSNAKPVAPGIYICRILALNEVGDREWAIKKMAIIR